MLMKRGTLAILLSTLVLLPSMAQTEATVDTLRPLQTPDIPTQTASRQRISDDGMRNYGGFLLDMNSMLQPSQPLMMTTPSLTAPMQTGLSGYKDLDKMLQLKSKATYGIGTTPFWPVTDNLHLASFRLNNGMTLTTYGDYDSSGRRHISPSALPWQRNNFQGAFRLKSADGKFSLQVRVSRGRGPY